MRKNFNSVQMFETSDVCNKFSKSVSYETLVDGTATTGTDIKQTRRLSEGIAVKPLSAVGTLTSLLCNSAKVVEKFFKKNFRDDRFCFCFAKVTALAFILILCTISESLAECQALNNKWSTICYDTWGPGKPDNCGDGCTYSYDNGKLTVTATKPTAVIPEGMFAPSYYEEGGAFPNITSIEIAGEFKTIGVHAFLNNAATISGKGGVLYTNSVGNNAVGGNTLTGTIIVSDKQSSLYLGQWYNANLNATVILPPTIKSISGWALYGLKLGTNAKIYCGVENCEELFSNVDCEGFFANETLRTQCKNHLNDLLDGKLLAYPDGCAKMGAMGCTKCKNENFKLNDGECDRLRYTPAEAAEVLTDDNNNSVTITFKK